MKIITSEQIVEKLKSQITDLEDKIKNEREALLVWLKGFYDKDIEDLPSSPCKIYGIDSDKLQSLVLQLTTLKNFYFTILCMSNEK